MVEILFTKSHWLYLVDTLHRISQQVSEGQMKLSFCFFQLKRGIVPIPRSTNFRHIASNVDIFDFQLTPEEVDAILQLNVGDKVYSFDPEPLEAMMSYYGIY